MGRVLYNFTYSFFAEKIPCSFSLSQFLLILRKNIFGKMQSSLSLGNNVVQHSLFLCFSVKKEKFHYCFTEKRFRRKLLLKFFHFSVIKESVKMYSTGPRPLHLRAPYCFSYRHLCSSRGESCSALSLASKW